MCSAALPSGLSSEKVHDMEIVFKAFSWDWNHYVCGITRVRSNRYFVHKTDFVNTFLPKNVYAVAM